MPTNLSIRMSDQEVESLDRLVVACRAFYKEQPPPFNRMADEVTRSSALRDLLLAWKLGKCDQFHPDITEPVDD